MKSWVDAHTNLPLRARWKPIRQCDRLNGNQAEASALLSEGFFISALQMCIPADSFRQGEFVHIAAPAFYVAKNIEELNDESEKNNYTRAIAGIREGLGKSAARVDEVVQRLWPYGKVGAGFGVTNTSRHHGGVIPDPSEKAVGHGVGSMGIRRGDDQDQPEKLAADN